MPGAFFSPSASSGAGQVCVIALGLQRQSPGLCHAGHAQDVPAVFVDTKLKPLPFRPVAASIAGTWLGCSKADKLSLLAFDGLFEQQRFGHCIHGRVLWMGGLACLKPF